MSSVHQLTDHCLDKGKYDDQILTCTVVIKEYLKQMKYNSNGSMIGKRALISFADPEKRVRTNVTLPIGIIDLNHCNGYGEIIVNK
jgi:hypothetical protein